MTEPWPEDEAFRVFAADVADAVMWARARGFSVDPVDTIGDGDRCCPMGALNKRYEGAHSPGYPAYCGGLEFWFTAGFDGRRLFDGTGDSVVPYYRLGQEYRRRALGEIPWGER